MISSASSIDSFLLNDFPQVKQDLISGTKSFESAILEKLSALGLYFLDLI